MTKIELPAALEPFRARIEATVKPAVKISTELAVQDSFFDSTFGGFPYLPKGFEYPKDSEGKPLTLLAQINWAQVPPLADYPRNGILQFYIAKNHEFYGVDFDKPREQKDWRVLYFPEVDRENYQTDFSFLGSFEDYYSETPFEIRTDEDGNCFKLSFETVELPVTGGDYQFDFLFRGNDGEVNIYSTIDDETWEEYYDIYDSSAHKIGGYAQFTQDDPRGYSKNRDDSNGENPWLLLLQIDSENGIMWGDAGIGNFFIRQNDLQALNFKDVWYNWDCG